MALKKGRVVSTVSSLVIGGDKIPSGTVSAFGGTVAPNGWAICDGSTVSRAERKELFEKIGTNFGSGNGSTTFHLPDLRGRFLQGASLTTGRDTNGRTVINSGGHSGNDAGSFQNYFAPDHSHGATSGTNGNMWSQVTIKNTDNVHSIHMPSPTWTSNGNGNESGSNSGGGFNDNGAMVLGATAGANAPAYEVHPVNVYVNYIIKL